jgi:hypothetical protein
MMLAATMTGAGMAAKGKRTPVARQDADEAQFEAWLKNFDARRADLSAQIDAVLRSLGVEPAKVPERETA